MVRSDRRRACSSPEGPDRSATAKHIYILNELLPALTHSKISSTGESSLAQKVSIVPPPPSSPADKGTKASTAELLLLATKPHKTIFASTRTLPDRDVDTLAQFELDEATGEVVLKDFVFPRRGREFRGVGVSKCGKFVMVAGQVSLASLGLTAGLKMEG
jgi:6-phosphogluconolactonase (cycloisomerase 2 family)